MAQIAEIVESKLKLALKNKDIRAVSVFRMLKSALVNERIAKIHDLSDDEETAVIRRELKKREDSVNQFRQAGREDRALEEEAEAEVLKVFLPPELPDEEIRALAENKVAETGADNFGKIMGAVMKEVAGRASGDRVQKIVKDLLTKK
ncbi:MAG: hypothetical protein A3J48_04515 [Candidatus Doudnabacteria bacterium RIFCSPHIGHO2_02_FULL_46_11]|uniref:Glutamyl-tRNA amidotransferase n=1 Tax=Candidatus Doudnabacteria bacterium RIFCSPHIGHO2_02_FULL_46_11 TaxID=1817832 RepID=A0A1F5P6F6_9BACT|nr:MAG: hypothetical protein A3J48_04515 [Candidatus Doudnabacteria bacterium RIFCSPHIGHO2_02_FULL_46_11]